MAECQWSWRVVEVGTVTPRHGSPSVKSSVKTSEDLESQVMDLEPSSHLSSREPLESLNVLDHGSWLNCQLSRARRTGVSSYGFRMCWTMTGFERRTGVSSWECAGSWRDSKERKKNWSPIGLVEEMRRWTRPREKFCPAAWTRTSVNSKQSEDCYQCLRDR